MLKRIDQFRPLTFVDRQSMTSTSESFVHCDLVREHVTSRLGREPGHSIDLERSIHTVIFSSRTPSREIDF